MYPIGFIGYTGAMLSQKSRYALRALLVLAARGDTEPVQISEIAEQRQCAAQIPGADSAGTEKARHCAQPSRPAGRLFAGPAAKDISFADVLRVTDGPLALSPCVSVMAYRKCDDCFDEAVCGIRKALLAARDATAEVLESRSLAAAAAQMRRAGAL